MPDLLLELRSEEIPARMQRKAAGDLKKMVTDGLVEAGLTYEAAREYWTPRRLVLDLRGLTARSRDVHEERKGPSTKAPEQAIQGFLRSAGLSSVEEAHIHSDPKKGDFYVAHIVEAGQGGRRDHRRADPRRRAQLSLAEGDALGRRFRPQGPDLFRHCRARRRNAALGAPAAVHRLHLRPRDRGAGGRRLRGRRHPFRQCHLRPPLPCARRHHRAPLRRLRRQARGGKGRHRRRPPQGDHPRRRQEPRLRQRARSGRGRRAAGGSVGPRRMAGRADRRVRAGFSGHPAGSHPPDHPRQPEMLRHAAAWRRGAVEPLRRSPPISRRPTAARRSRTATARWCARGFPTRCISGRPTRPTCRTSTS